MNVRHWMPVLVLSLVGLAMGGCLGDDVVYVDEQGNELAVDKDGKPVYQQPAPARAPAVVTTRTPAEPPSGAWNEPPYTPVVIQPPTVAQPEVPVEVTSPDAPPAGALPPVPSMQDLPSPPSTAGSPTGKPLAPKAKKVDTSSGLDIPPAG